MSQIPAHRTSSVRVLLSTVSIISAACFVQSLVLLTWVEALTSSESLILRRYLSQPCCLRSFDVKNACSERDALQVSNDAPLFVGLGPHISQGDV